jgi:hypothetical protein
VTQPGTLVPVALFAHQGGWDELIFVLFPIALFAGLLAMANRRADRAQSQQEPQPGDEE